LAGNGLEDLGRGVWRSQTPLWQTNALLALADGEALLCDPGYTPEEIERLAARARRGGGPIHLLVTHADFDHTCGIPHVREASVAAGAETARLIESGTAAERLAAAGSAWGLNWETELRVDRILEPGPTTLGAFRIESIETPGHTADGLAYVLLDQGVLFPGDYLSAMTYPFLTASLRAAQATHEGLLSALDRHDLRWVVPGHGPVLTPAQAREVGEADLAYLERLARAAQEALRNGLSPGYALLHAYAVEPPRATTDDFEIFGLRELNAKQALAEVSRG
jgi:glyoxylase-like metal-dependent hydrolase (beta-lactamase superfamily II)